MDLLENASTLTNKILHRLHKVNQHIQIFPTDVDDLFTASGVLLLLDQQCDKNGPPPEPCLILNKRSRRVKQPGDLCCPGGRIIPSLDYFFAKLLTLPLFPLGRWPYWSHWRRGRHREAQRLALLFATSLRESSEEMRLNPLGVRFLGPLQPESLVMFERHIFPMVCWVRRQKRFRINWEVEKVVYIPLRNLLNPIYYGRYRLSMAPNIEINFHHMSNDFPCFVHQKGDEKEVLWGATYRIVTLFLKLIFGFEPPDLASLQVVPGILDENYYNGV